MATRDEIDALIARADSLIREAQELQKELLRLTLERARANSPAAPNKFLRPEARNRSRKRRR